MGYASYLENILENQAILRDARAEFESIRGNVERRNEAESRRRLISLRESCAALEKSLLRLETFLSSLAEIATHPYISIAHRYVEDSNRLNRLDSETREFIERHKKDQEALESALASKNEVEIELRTRIILLEDENRKLKRQNKTIKEEIVYKKNPQALLGTVKPLKKK